MLNQLLSSFHLSATVFHRSFFHRTLVCDSWSTDTSGNGHANFHLISSGKAYLHSNQHNGTLLNAGDMVLFIRDSAHLLSYSPEAQLSNAAENEPSQFIAYPMEVPLENSTGLICGYFDFGSDQQHPVLQQFRD